MKSRILCMWLSLKLDLMTPQLLHLSNCLRKSVKFHSLIKDCPYLILGLDFCVYF